MTSKETYWAFMRNNQSIYWKAISNQQRHAAISEIETVINRFGFVMDFHMFSDIDICFNIEIQEKKMTALYTALSECITMDTAEIKASESEMERKVNLNITFVKGTGNLKIEIPAVPG